MNFAAIDPVFFSLISFDDIGIAVPVILSLIIIEGLLSVDNALAIAAMASHLPGRQKIRALRFLAAYCIKLIERFPVLEKTAFLLVGYVGCLLLVEICLDFDIGAFGKFIGIMFITFTTVAYSRHSGAQKILAPVLTGIQKVMRFVTRFCETLLLPLKWFFMIPKKLFIK